MMRIKIKLRDNRANVDTDDRSTTKGVSRNQNRSRNVVAMLSMTSNGELEWRGEIEEEKGQ